MGNEGQKICGDLPETTAFKSYAAKQERRSQYANYSDLPAVSFLRLTHSEASEGYPTIVNNIQPCPKLCLLMPLAYVGARTDSTSYTATREAWPISTHTHWRSRQDMLYLRRGFSTLVLLVFQALVVLEPLVLLMSWFDAYSARIRGDRQTVFCHRHTVFRLKGLYQLCKESDRVPTRDK